MSDQVNRPRCPVSFLKKAAPAEPLSATLKSSTQKQHDEAEGHPLHAVMFGSQGVPAARESYARTLGQHLPIQEVFEPLLLASARRAPWGGVVKPYHAHLAALREDCEAMGVTADMRRAMPAAQRFIERITGFAGGDGWGLLGVFYVFEGSTNGGTIIAMRVRELLGLVSDAGTRFINPHGRDVRPRWTKWRDDVDALSADGGARAAAVAGAREAFTLSHQVLSDVAGAMATPISGKPEVVVLPVNAAKR